MQRALWVAIATTTLGFAHGAWAGMFCEDGMRCIKDNNGYHRCFVINKNGKQNTMGFVKAKIDQAYYKDDTMCITLKESGRGFCTRSKGWLNRFWPKDGSMRVFKSENNNVICKINTETGEFSCVGDTCHDGDISKCWHEKIRLTKHICKKNDILARGQRGKPTCWQVTNKFALDAKRCKGKEVCYSRIHIEKRPACKEGYEFAENRCIKFTEKEPKYVCKKNYKLKDGMCHKTAKPKGKGKCPNGFMWKKGKCFSEKAKPAQMICPREFELAEGMCVRELVREPKIQQCPMGYSDQGNVCVHKPMVTAGKLTCPKGSKQMNGLCVQRSLQDPREVQEATVRCGGSRCTVRGYLKSKQMR